MGNSTKMAPGPAAGDEAMARYAEGDQAAFAEVYAVAAPRLARFFRRRLFDTSAVPAPLYQIDLDHVARALQPLPPTCRHAPRTRRGPRATAARPVRIEVS